MRELIDFGFCARNHGFASDEETLAWFNHHELRDFRTFTPDFSSVEYLLAHPDLREAGVDPIIHYLKHGAKEHRAIKPVPRARAFAGADAATRAMPDEDVRVAVVLHIYYPEFIPYFLARLARFDLPHWDVFVSAPAGLIEAHGQELRDALGERLRDMRAVPNRGRNFAPMLVDFADRLGDYDAICHCHSKQSLYSGSAQRDWANYLVAGTIGAADTVRRHVNLLVSGQCDLISPVPFGGIPAWASHSLSNDADFRQLCDRLGLDPATGFMAYPVGGMFWMTGSLYRELCRLNLTYEDFPPEPSRPDGELHHALERLLGRLAGRRQAFYEQMLGVYWSADATLRFETQRFSKPEELREAIRHRDFITFDFFDTLAVRSTGDEEWAKRRVEFVFGQNYHAHRNDMESRLRSQLGVTGDVPMPAIAQGLAGDGFIDAERAVALERSLDFETLMPRPEIVDAFNYAIDEGKHVLIVSDSYYDKGLVEAFLTKFGIAAPAAILMSADIGLRKDRGDMWGHVAALRGRRVGLHVGDNVHSDIQKAAQHGFHTFYVAHWRQELLPFSGFSKAVRERNLTNPAFARSIDREPPESPDDALSERDLDDHPRRFSRRRRAAPDRAAR